jgi:hypothetical protein
MMSYQTEVEFDYLCPISKEVMTDPVVAADGQTYQRQNIEEWLRRGNRKSPLNGSDLSHTIITSNIFAKKVIEKHTKVI